MAEDQEKIEPSGPAPQLGVPYEELFLSTEKEYPTEEARQKALEDARKPEPKPVIARKTITVGHLEAKGGAEPLKRILKAQESVDKPLQFMPEPQLPPQVPLPTPQEQKGGIGNFFKRLFNK